MTSGKPIVLDCALPWYNECPRAKYSQKQWEGNWDK